MNILIASALDADAIDHLRKQHNVICAINAPNDELCHHIADCDTLIFRSGVNITAQVMACAPNLRLLIRAGSGCDNIDLNYVHSHGLVLIRIPQPGARAVAELTFAFMLALSRQIVIADQLMRKGHWAKHELTGHSLMGKVLGIVGAGNIGTCVGQMGAAWGMEVVGCVGHPSAEVAARLCEKHIRLVAFSDLLSQADFVSIHVPLNKQTQNLINTQTLQHMKPGACLLNLARGGVVDEHALYRALQKGPISGAALDVHQQEGEGIRSPLAELPNVILTPHIGSMTVEAQHEIGRRVIEIVQGVASGRAVASLAKEYGLI